MSACSWASIYHLCAHGYVQSLTPRGTSWPLDQKILLQMKRLRPREKIHRPYVGYTEFTGGTRATLLASTPQGHHTCRHHHAQNRGHIPQMHPPFLALLQACLGPVVVFPVLSIHFHNDLGGKGDRSHFAFEEIEE